MFKVTIYFTQILLMFFAEETGRPIQKEKDYPEDNYVLNKW